MNPGLRVLLGSLMLLMCLLPARADVITGSGVSGQPMDLYGNKIDKPDHEHKPGELVTVLVAESVSTSTDLESTIKDDFSISTPTGGGLSSGPLGFLPSITNQSSNDSTGQNTVSQKSLLATTITVRVVNVDPSGNLVLEGKRELISNGKKITLLLHGVARAKDIQDNTVSSTRLSDLSFTVNGMPKKSPLQFLQKILGVML